MSWAWIDRIGILLFDATVSTVLFTSSVMLAMLGCRQPARRILLARGALLASLAMIPLVALGPWPRLDLVDLVVESELIPTPLPFASDPISSPPASSGGRIETPIRDRGISARLGPPPAAAGRWWWRGLIVLDLAGVGAGLAWLLLGFGGVWWLIRRSRLPSPPTRELYDQLRTGGSAAVSRIALRVSSRVQHPVVVGWFRPVILIPRSLDQPGGDAAALRLSLLHELAHAERSDPWFGTAASLAQAVWFVLPQVWWLRSQLRIDQEFLADRAAARRYGSSFGYASSLLAMAARPGARGAGRGGGPPGPKWQASGKSGIQSPLFQRVLMLLHCPFPIEACTPHFWSWTSKLTLIGTALLAACLLIRWPHAAAVEQRASPRVPAPSQRFAISQFVIEPQIVPPGGRSVPSILPLALPAEFDLQVEVRTTQAELAQLRIAGYPLGDARRLAADPHGDPPAPANSWRRVHLHRDRRGVSLEIDGRAVPVDSGAEPDSDWLTIEPGSQDAAEFRNLIVSW